MNTIVPAAIQVTVSTPLVFFVHLPKTGGSTMRTILKNAYSDDATHLFSPMRACFESRFDSYAFHLERMRTACHDSSKVRLVYGHMFYGLHEQVGRPARYVTVMRRPVDRVLSNFYYRAQHGHCEATKDSLIKYVRGMSSNPAMQFEADNLQTRLLAGRGGAPRDVAFGQCSDDMVEDAKRNLNAFDVVGLTEQFEETVKRLAIFCDWPFVPSFVPERITQSYPRKEQTDPDIIEEIKSINRCDLELYTHAEKLFRGDDRGSG